MIKEHSITQLLFGVIGVTAATNAFNFIDGVNGISSGIGIYSLCMFVFLVGINPNYTLIIFMIAFVSCIFGFFVINIFSGKIFLGDLGAYLIGFFISTIGVAIVKENSTISPWIIFLIILYPATELIFSTFRRLFNGVPPFKADDKHLHSIIYKLILKKISLRSKHFCNSLTGIIIVLFGSLPGIIYINYNNNSIIFKIIFTYISLYCLVYFILHRIEVFEE